MNFLVNSLQSYSHQDTMVLAQRQKYRPVEQDRKPRDMPIHLWDLIFDKRRIYNGEKTVSSICGAGKTGELHAKEQKNTSNSKHKNKLKMD